MKSVCMCNFSTKAKLTDSVVWMKCTSLVNVLNAERELD